MFFYKLSHVKFSSIPMCRYWVRYRYLVNDCYLVNYKIMSRVLLSIWWKMQFEDTVYFFSFFHFQKFVCVALNSIPLFFNFRSDSELGTGILLLSERFKFWTLNLWWLFITGAGNFKKEISQFFMGWRRNKMATKQIVTGTYR